MSALDFLTTEDNHKIAYKHYKKGNDKTIIIVHGFYNSKDSELLGKLKDELFKKYDVFMFDFRGHGQSSGFFTWTAREGYDLKAVLKYLDGQYKKTAILAFSFGGSISINVLSEKNYNIDSFICVSVPSDPSRVDYKWWNLDWENDIHYSMLTKNGRKGKGVRLGPFWLKKQKPINNIQALKMPVLYIHGSKDWVIDKWHSDALYSKTTVRKELFLINNGLHAEYLLRKNKNEFIKKINTWLSETL